MPSALRRLVFDTDLEFAGDTSAAADRLRLEASLANLNATLDLAGAFVAMSAVNAAVLVPLFWGTAARWLTIDFFLLMLALGLAVTRAVAAFRPSVRSHETARTTHHIVCAGTAVFGAVWGLVPLCLFGPADDLHRACIVAVILAVVASLCLLVPQKLARVLFAVPLAAGAAVGAGHTGEVGMVVAFGIALYAGACVAVGTRLHGPTAKALRAAARNRDKADVVDVIGGDVSPGAAWLWEADRDGHLLSVPDGIFTAVGAPCDPHLAFKSILASAEAGGSRSDSAEAVLRDMARREPLEGRLVEIKTGGPSIWWRLDAKPVRDGFGAHAGYRGIGVDVTLLHEAQAQIARLRDFDPLTGLQNRARFLADVERECAGAVVAGRRPAMLVVNLDGFRHINADNGHQLGDALLKIVAGRLGHGAPRHALVARLGDDEFAVFYSPLHPSMAETLAGSLIDILESPFEIDGALLTIRASIGIAYAASRDVRAEALLRMTGVALSRAKAEGKGCYRLFQPDDARAPIAQRALEADLKLALARREFALHYQPLLDLASGRIVCCEALLRWPSPTRGNVSPSEFIPTAERTGQIIAIDRWVLMRACQDAARWDGAVQVAVNISPPHFRSRDLLQDVSVALNASGLHPSRLQIEITEGVFLDNSPTAIDNLHGLRRRGIEIALDDFGTGFSSLNYLIKFPVDKIKIDRSFINDLVTRPESRAVVDALLMLARKLSIRVTAEGVETIEQALALKLRRCDDIQGYLVSKPRPGDEVADMLATVPGTFRAMVPMMFDSPLALALAMRKREAA